MDIVFHCHDCEREITLPERPTNGKIMCPSCRTVLNVPEPGCAAEEVGVAYTTPQVKRCPQCNKESAQAAVLCIHCGYNFQSGKQTKKVIRVKGMERSWWYGPIPFFHKSVDLQKTSQGKTLVKATTHLLGIPIATTEIDLRECQELWTDYRRGFGPLGWGITLVLFLLCICPGLLWMVIAWNKPTYIVRLPRFKGSTITLYEGMSEDTMRDLLDSIAEMGQLKIVRK